MATIALVRVDMRLVHGQVIAKWVKHLDVDRILVADDYVARDAFLSRLYVSAAPPSVAIEVLTIDDLVAQWQRNQFGSGRVLVLFKNVPTMMLAWRKGFAFPAVQIGGLGGGPGRKPIYHNINASKEDIDELTALSNAGVDVTFQAIPEETPAKLAALLPKIKF